MKQPAKPPHSDGEIAMIDWETNPQAEDSGLALPDYLRMEQEDRSFDGKEQPRTLRPGDLAFKTRSSLIQETTRNTPDGQIILKGLLPLQEF
jgi:hypothetical protein